MRKLTAEEVQAQLPSHITLNKETYIRTKIKAEFIDSEYGSFWALPNNVTTKGANHPKRASASVSKKNSYTLEELKALLPISVKLHEDTYVNTATLAKFTDDKFGEWWTKPCYILSGRNHPKRGEENKKNKLRPKIQYIIDKLPSHIKIIESTYVKCSEKATFVDEKFGEWEAMPYSVIAGHGHPNRVNQTSKGESTLLDFIKSINEEFIPRHKVKSEKSWKEVDCYLPNKKIGIEYNGLRWHSELFKDKKYHMEKRELCNKNGITLLQINEDEWTNSSDIVKSIIKAKLSLNTETYHARKLTVKDVDGKSAEMFLIENHLMGGFKSAKHIGLYNGETLVSLISYKKYKDGIDISRFCNKKYTNVVGGLSRLLKKVEECNPKAKFIQSFVDLRYGTGDSLLSVGFTLESTTLGWKWTDGKASYNRLYCKADKSKGLTERQNADRMKIYKTYDAGQAKFVRKTTHEQKSN